MQNSKNNQKTKSKSDAKNRSANSGSNKSIQSADLNTQPLQLKPQETVFAPENNFASSFPTQRKASSNDSLPDDVMTKMEGSFGTDFSDVSFLQNSSKATTIQAKAYTQGNDIHFAPGQFNPKTTQGQELIGHELAHVVQQRQGKVKTSATQAKFNINTDTTLETEADKLGARAARWNSSQTPTTSFSRTSSPPNTTVQRKTSDLEFAQHMAKSFILIDKVENVGGQLCSKEIFDKITYEGFFTKKGKAKEQIGSVITEVEKKLPKIVYDGKKQTRLINLNKEELLLAQKYLLIARGIASVWAQEEEGDTDSVKRAFGFQLFLKHTEDLLNEVSAVFMQKNIAVSEEEISKNVEAANQDERLTSVKEHYANKSAKSIFTNLGFAVGKIAPDPWSKGTIEVEVNIPIEPTGIAYLGGRFFIEAERENPDFTCRTEVDLVGGAKVPGIFNVQGKLGGYVESKGNSPEQAMKLVSYGFYKKLKESKLFGRFADWAWGGKNTAQKFAQTTEKEAFTGKGAIDDAYIEMGLQAGAKGEIGDSTKLGASAEIKGMAGTRYDKDTTGDNEGKGTKGFTFTLAVSSGVASGEVSYTLLYAGGKLAKKEVAASINSTSFPPSTPAAIELMQTLIGKIQEAAEKGEEKKGEELGKLGKGYEKLESTKEKYDIACNLVTVAKGQNELIPSAPTSSSTKGDFEGSGIDAGLDISALIDLTGQKATGHLQLSTMSKYSLKVGVLSSSATYKTNMFRFIFDGSKWSMKLVKQNK